MKTLLNLHENKLVNYFLVVDSHVDRLYNLKFKGNAIASEICNGLEELRMLRKTNSEAFSNQGIKTTIYENAIKGC